LLVFKRKVLRMIYGPKIIDDVYRSRYNLELDRDFNSPNVIGIVKINRLCYADHMFRGSKYLPQRALFRACRKADETKQARNLDQRMA
jgi:hypothetical protein